MSTAGPAIARRRGPFGLLAEGLGAIGTIWIFFLMLLINADVIGRYFFNKPLVGTWRNRGVTTAGTGWSPRNAKGARPCPRAASMLALMCP